MCVLAYEEEQPGTVHREIYWTITYELSLTDNIW